MDAMQMCYCVLILAGAFALVGLGVLFIRTAGALKQTGDTVEMAQETLKRVDKVLDDVNYKLDLLNAPVETVAKFLKEHPTEGIVMRLSFSQNKKCQTSECVEKNFMNVLNRHSDILYVNDTIPVMKDIRGKVFLITGGITYKSEFKWGSRITLQDDYQFIGDGDKAIAHKKEEVQEVKV